MAIDTTLPEIASTKRSTLKLAGKIAIVTGAGSGFGESIAHLYAREGARVVVLDVRADAASSVAREIGDRGIAVTADVTCRQDIDRALETTVRTFGIPHIVVNNAGVSHRNQPLLDVDEATFDHVFRVNVKSIYFMTHAVVPLMRQNGGGVILNMGSTAGIRPRPGLTWYNGSKGAVSLLSKSMAVELAPDCIRVNVLCPALAETPLLETFMGLPDTPENRARFLASIPLGRLAKPADVAATALFLASDDAEYISGVEFPIDGARCV